MAATNLQANWTVSFPTSGTTFNMIDDVTVDKGGTLEKYSGDLSHWNTIALAMMSEPTIDVSSSNPYQFMTIANGFGGTLIATHADAKLATLGAVVYTMNAVFRTAKTNGPHAKFGTVSASFDGISTDGVTDPIGYGRI